MKQAKEKHIILTILLVIIIPLFMSIIISPIASAADSYDPEQGNHDTAQKKEWATLFFDCANRQHESWPFVFDASIKISSKTLNGSKWFNDGGLYSSWTDYRSAYVEKQVAGEYSDGSLTCGEKGNALLQKSLSSLEISDKEDIVCDWRSRDNAGMLVPVVDTASCDTYYKANDEKSLFYRVDENSAKTYLTELAISKNTKKAKIGRDDLFSLTQLEEYYVKYDAFTSACVSGGAQFGKDGTYTIQEINPATGKVEKAGYSGLENPGRGTNIPWFLEQYMTCGDLASDLSEGSPLVKELNNYATYAEDQGIDPSDDGSKGDSDEVEKNCQNQGGAGSLGWIVCSILDWMQRTTTTMYDEVVEPSLKVEKSFFEDTNTFTAWETFRDISNIIFTILILFVIFSQVTGVGIDNYGIKKILPKLIIAAVLVNLSYWICLICVDVSNILGAGLQDFFNGLNSGSTASVTYGGEGGGDTNVAMDVGIVGVSVAGAAVSIVAIFSNPALLLTLFIAVLGVLISVLFMFVLLAGRKAAIVLLTVFSPVAFVLYLLPNTKKLFDKWLKLWESMLLLYPIAGLLIGGGNFASGLMLSNYKGTADGASVVPIFTAMIVGIIPIFFIPTVLKGAFSAMGTIGGMMAGAGNRLRSGATGRMRNSDLYKNAQQMGLDRKNRVKSGLNKNGDLTKLGRLRHKAYNTPVGKFFGADRRLNARTKAARKTMSDQEEASATSMELLSAAEMGNAKDVMDPSGNKLFDGSRENYYAGKFMQAAENKDRRSMNAAISAAKAAGVKDKDVAKMVRNAVNSGKLSGKNDAQMSLWLQSQASTNKALAKDIELQDWAAKGGTETLGGYGDYIGAGHMSVSDLDKAKIGNASTDSLAGLASKNKLPTGIAQEVLQDESMQLSPDKRIILGAAAEGKIKTGASVEDIKNDAEALLATGSVSTNTGIIASDVDAGKWTAPSVERVTIDQQKTNEIPVRVTTGSPTPPPPPPPGYKDGSNYQQNSSGIWVPHK